MSPPTNLLAIATARRPKKDVPLEELRNEYAFLRVPIVPDEVDERTRSRHTVAFELFSIARAWLCLVVVSLAAVAFSPFDLLGFLPLWAQSMLLNWPLTGHLFHEVQDAYGAGKLRWDSPDQVRTCLTIGFVHAMWTVWLGFRLFRDWRITNAGTRTYPVRGHVVGVILVLFALSQEPFDHHFLVPSFSDDVSWFLIKECLLIAFVYFVLAFADVFLAIAARVRMSYSTV